MPNPTTPVSVIQAYDLALWIFAKIENFPRSQRYLLGDRLANTALDLLLALVRACYSSEKRSCLEQANQFVNLLRFLLRLAKDLKLINLDSYAFASERGDEIGRMIGGWRKHAGGESK